MLDKCTCRTAVHFLGCTHKSRKSDKFVQLEPVIGKDKTVRKVIIAFSHRRLKSLTVTRDLDYFICACLSK